MKPVAICESLLTRVRNGETETSQWIAYLNEHQIPYEIISCYSYDIVDRLNNYSALIWHYSNFVNADLMEAQHILDIAAQKGLQVFPNHATGWHFDDKIAEAYAFRAAGAPTPQNWVFYDYKECYRWLETEAKYSLVAKLRRGFGSNNVKLLKSVEQAKKYARRMFSKGFSPAQSLLYKTYSKMQSTHDWETFVSRLKKIPNFLKARRFGKGMPTERGYAYFQEFTPNDGYDIKVAVVGDKLSYLIRKTRQGDFRASGGGDIYYDRPLMTPQIIKSAFAAADALQMQCVGFDYVVDNCTGAGKIIEMCFGFDFDAIYDAGGYFDRDCVWHNEPMNVTAEVLKNLFN